VQSQRVPGGHLLPEEAPVETLAALQAFFGEPGAQDVGDDQHIENPVTRCRVDRIKAMRRPPAAPLAMPEIRCTV
jgi:hypothetical protein